jgi:CRISPR-associated protein Cas1
VSDDDVTALIPARIVNEHSYCPRLAYLMWVDGANADNAATVEGTHVHRNVDRPYKHPDDADRPRTVRALALGDEHVGVTAMIDLVELDGQEAVPIEYKRGPPGATTSRCACRSSSSYSAQVALLGAHGFTVRRAEVWFDAARRRVAVPLPDDLELRVATTVAELRENAGAGAAPPPLKDDAKCPHCVLVGLCLPDEHRAERGESERACDGRRRSRASTAPVSE